MAVCVVVPLGPACVDFQGVRANDRNAVRLTIRSGGAPLDITGTLAAQARKKATDPDPAPLEAEFDIIDAPNGVVMMTWPGDQVQALVAASGKWSGVWDLEYTQAPLAPLTLAAGKISLEADVTR
jgi:hypothetical protein